MSPNTPAPSQRPQDGSSITDTLRHCLAPGLLMVDGDGKIATLTPRAATLLGLETSDASERPVALLPESLLALVREVMTSGSPAGDRELDLTLPRHGKSRLRVNAMPFRSASQNTFVVLALTDLSPVAHYEQPLMELDRLANLGTLAAGSAHEVRNALVASKTFIDLLLEKNQDADLANVVRREIGRMDTIISRLLNFAVPPAAAFGPLHLHEVLDYCLRLVQPQLQGKSIAVERSFRAASDIAQGDESALQQVFMNLLLNGYEAMNGHGTLTVGTEAIAAPVEPHSSNAVPTPLLRVTVQDTGAGIRPENLPHIFEPFFTTKPGGTGLGLAISQRIIQQHQGLIVVDSQPGRGTTFTVTLPAPTNGS